MNIARRTTPHEGTASERFPTHRGPTDSHWSTRIATSDRLKPTRDQARRFLVEHAVPPRYADNIVLTLSELLSNALTCGETAGMVTAELSCQRPHLIKLTVTNQRSTQASSEFPPPSTEMPNPGREHGRGLPLVASLASRLSIEGKLGSTRVRADFVC
jgi:anti-sigma regulatory factor (Ser/Thr protein kinase)